MLRARSAIDRGCNYKLGAGGRRWHKGTPWHPLTFSCDCSGFVAWCLEVDRHTSHPFYKNQNGGWLETSAIYRDSQLAGVGMFDAVTWQDALLGDLLVWPDRNGKQGHVGIVSESSPVGPSRVIHCSAGNWRLMKDAIQETSVGLWLNNGGVVARYAGLVVG